MKKLLPFVFITITVVIVGWFVFLISQSNVEVLNPKGIIAASQRDLIYISYAILFSVFFPVIGIALFIAWRYRSGNKNSLHTPDGEGSKFTLIIYSIFLAEIMIVFFYIVWRSSHDLDPRKPLVSQNVPITIQVVALDWKWLFIYPEENIATLNFLQVPVNTPINFRLTADGPMNSFWIPQIGGQIYAMAGMETKINLMADTPGDYNGGAAEINGKGFAGMRFVTRSSSESEYEDWVSLVKNSGEVLTQEKYEKLSKPSENTPVIYYSEVEEGLYNNIMKKYMAPPQGKTNGH